MSTPKIFESEYRFCLILWEHEPLPSAELAKLCKAVQSCAKKGSAGAGRRRIRSSTV